MNLINKQTVVAAAIGMVAPLLCLLAINGYGRTNHAQARAVSETRVVSSGEPAVLGTPGHACPDTASDKASQPAAFTWQAPDGWTDAGTKGLRVANFTVGPAGEAECYVTLLNGTGGGVAMNVNRWRAQLGLPEATEEEISALPKVAALGGEAILVDLEGTYGGSGDGVHTGSESRDAYRLLGAIAQRNSDAVFVKMTGPASVVAAERDKFFAFVGSLNDAAVASAAAGAAGDHKCCPQEH